MVDKGSLGAEALGTAINEQLQQASHSIALQTKASQNAFQVLQNRALSDSTPFVLANQRTFSLECCNLRCMQQQRCLAAGMEGPHGWDKIGRSQQSPSRARPCFKDSSNVAAAIVRYLQYYVYASCSCACGTCYMELCIDCSKCLMCRNNCSSKR